MKNVINFLKKHKVSIWIFVIYIAITLFVFRHKLPFLLTHYGMSDVDPDGAIWYFWMRIFSEQNMVNFLYTNKLIAFPFGYDMSYIPFFSLIYEICVNFIKAIGFNWKSIILALNLSTLIAYPLSAISTYALALYVTKNKKASFLAGLIFAFSFHYILMGRGSLAQNHLELIPLYFLSLIYFLDHKLAKNAVLSALVFSLMFLANAYWAFYSGIFSVLFMFFYNAKFEPRLFLKYYAVLVMITASLNINFFINQAYVFNSVSLEKSGKLFNAEDQVVNILSYFIPSENNYLYNFFTSGNNFLGYAALLLGLSGIFILQKNRKYFVFFSSFLLSILLSTNIPGLFFVNDLYFKYFGMFRSVSRLNLFASLFLAVMVALTVQFIDERFVRNGKNFGVKISYGVIFVGVIALIVAEGLNSDKTWYKLSDFSQNYQLYSVIRDDASIRAIASYPMTMSNGTNGFPPNYERLGQVVHGKALVGGVSPYDQEALDFNLRINDIKNPNTIDSLAQANIDTIMIYSDILLDSERIVTDLKKDNRLLYRGEYRAGDDNSTYRSLNELTRHFYMFQIKSVLEMRDTVHQDLYIKKTAQKYEIDLSNYKNGESLVIDEPYSEKWRAYSGVGGVFAELKYLFVKPIDWKHVEYQHINQWTIENNKSANQMITLYYIDDLYIKMSSMFSWLVFLICLVYVFKNYLLSQIEKFINLIAKI